MSPNNEYVALLKYAIHLHIDISTFATVGLYSLFSWIHKTAILNM